MSITPNLINEVSDLIKSMQFSEVRSRLNPVLKSEPKNAWANCAMGMALFFQGDLINAEKYLLKAIHLDATCIDAYCYMGIISSGKSMPNEVVEGYFQKAIEINKNHFNTLFSLGQFYYNTRRYNDAEKVLGEANKIQPDNKVVLNYLGETSVKLNKWEEALVFFRHLVKVFPDETIGRANYLVALRTTNRHNELIEQTKCCVEQKMHGLDIFPAFYALRFFCMWDSSRKMLEMIREKVETNALNLPDGPIMEIGMAALAMPEIDYDFLFKLHKVPGKILEKNRVGEAYKTFPLTMRPSKRWRIGYFSPDFCSHVASWFLAGLVIEHNRQFFEIYCYSNTLNTDTVTDIYKSKADVFVDVTKMSDRELADKIYEDGIHILVYATAFTENSRNGLMCYRPAPVQMMYMGYPYTTGIPEVDYFISDPYVDGSENAQYFVEQQLRLPDSFCAFSMLSQKNTTEYPPCFTKEWITFGTLTNLYKINEKVVAVWAKILNAVPSSKMIINRPSCKPEEPRENLRREFLKYGIDSHRIMFIWEGHPQANHLNYYNDIDIMLDTFPLTGGNTTFDAISMGVPVITFVGKLYHERISYSILKNIGLPVDDLIAFTFEEYVEKAITLAGDKEKIRYYRYAIPEALKSSILYDPVRLARDMEAAFLKGWDRKFSTRPVNMDAMVSVAQHSLQNDLVFVTENSLNNVFHYVWEEQGQWYEPEWSFIHKIAEHGMHILDIGAEVGHYALPFAKGVGAEGKVWATTRWPHEAVWIRKSLELNPKLAIDIVLEGSRKLYLDQMWSIHCQKKIMDIVRVHSHFAIIELLKSGETFFSDNDSLIMFGMYQSLENTGYDLGFLEGLKKLGYQIFRLVPGLDGLIPYVDVSELDIFASNMFACKVSRMLDLKKKGVLLESLSILAESDRPGWDQADWQKYLIGLNYAASYVAGWANTPQKVQNWELYWVALNLYAKAQSSSAQLSLRYSCLKEALNILSALVQQEPRFPRVVTLLRVLTDLGQREQAVRLLGQVCVKVNPDAGIIMDEPFVALSNELAHYETPAQLGRSVFADLVQQREKLRAFSSYFNASNTLPVLQAMEATGFSNDVMRRRMELIQRRFG